METDRTLIRDARCFANRDRPDKRISAAAWDKLGKYLVASGLANGPNPSRAVVWKKMAILRKGDLQAFLNKQKSRC